MAYPWPPFPALLTFWVVMGEHCPRSCSSYSGQCRHIFVGVGPAFHAFRRFGASAALSPEEPGSYSGAAFAPSTVTVMQSYAYLCYL